VSGAVTGQGTPVGVTRLRVTPAGSGGEGEPAGDTDGCGFARRTRSRAPAVTTGPTGLERLPGVLAGLPVGVSTEDLAQALQALRAAGLDDLPLPAAGQTLVRWRVLAAIAAHDVGLVKLAEGHTDALATLAELGGDPERGATWGLYAAEPPDAQVLAQLEGRRGLRLDGRKAWCSGAAVLDRGLLTCRGPLGERLLAAVDLRHRGVRGIAGSWHAVGMAATGSLDVELTGVPAVLVGEPGDYLSRPGFWHGAAGIAACWHGGAQGVAAPLLARAARARGVAATPLDPHSAAHLGAIDADLGASAALLRATAAALDVDPAADARLPALRVRAAAEAAATGTLGRTGRALGAGPLCRDGDHARRVADLTVFLRQSHAERDLRVAGDRADGGAWAL